MKRIHALLLCATFLLIIAAPSRAQAQSQAQDRPQATQPADAAAQKTTDAKKDKNEIKYYNYANDQSEYSIMLPEAPTVETVWGKSPETETYLLGDIPKDTSFLGEIARFKRTNIDSEETFTAKVIFLKATDDFLAGLTEAKIKSILESSYAHMVFINPTFHYSASSGTGALKWATLSGFTVDENHQPLFTATHYLTGLHSIYVVRVQFSVTNRLYGKYYKKLVDSITYSSP